VQDTGIGISADDLPQLFSRFHRGRNAAAYPGSGLGLAIVRATVESHQGQVMAESTPQGARFLLWLPRAGQKTTPATLFDRRHRPPERERMGVEPTVARSAQPTRRF